MSIWWWTAKKSDAKPKGHYFIITAVVKSESETFPAAIFICVSFPKRSEIQRGAVHTSKDHCKSANDKLMDRQPPLSTFWRRTNKTKLSWVFSNFILFGGRGVLGTIIVLSTADYGDFSNFNYLAYSLNLFELGHQLVILWRPVS